MFGINKSDLAGAGRWVRDHFSNWFANSFVMVGVFFIIMASIYIGMYFDGEYARRWAPHDDANNIFMSYGWLISLAMVFFTAVGIKAFQEGARAAGVVFITAGLYFTILSATQSVGVVTLKAQQMMASADAFEKIETTDTTRLDFLQAERSDLIAKRDGEIARIQSSIEAIQNDGIPGIPRADQDSIDNYNARIDEIRNNAQAAIDAKGDEIKAEMVTPDTPDEVVIAPARFDAGIDFWAYVLTFGKPTDQYKEGLTYWYMLFWSIGCPIMGQMLAVYLVITRRTSEQAYLKDPVRVEAGKKAAKTRKSRKRRGEQITLRAETMAPAWKHAVRLATNTRWTAENIAETAFKGGDIGEVINVLKKAEEKRDPKKVPEPYITEAEIRLVRRLDKGLPVVKNANAVDVIHADPKTTNGSGQPYEEGTTDADDTDTAGSVPSN